MQSAIMRRWLILLAVIALAGQLLGLGGNHRNCETIRLENVPPGLDALINLQERALGFFVNAEHRFYYAGDAAAFAAFLKQYVDISPIAGHRLTIHEGTCQAKFPWDDKIDPAIGCWK